MLCVRRSVLCALWYLISKRPMCTSEDRMECELQWCMVGIFNAQGSRIVKVRCVLCKCIWTPFLLILIHLKLLKTNHFTLISIRIFQVNETHSDHTNPIYDILIRTYVTQPPRVHTIPSSTRISSAVAQSTSTCAVLTYPLCSAFTNPFRQQLTLLHLHAIFMWQIWYTGADTFGNSKFSTVSSYTWTNYL